MSSKPQRSAAIHHRTEGPVLTANDLARMTELYVLAKELGFQVTAAAFDVPGGRMYDLLFADYDEGKLDALFSTDGNQIRAETLLGDLNAALSELKADPNGEQKLLDRIMNDED